MRNSLLNLNSLRQLFSLYPVRKIAQSMGAVPNHDFQYNAIKNSCIGKNTWFHKVLLLTALLSLSNIVYATEKSSNAKWFRYYNNGVPQLSQTLTDAHLKNGYEELDASFRVLRAIKPYSAETAKKAHEQALADEKKSSEASQARNKLIQTYGSSERAVRKRKELLNDIQSKRGFAQQQLSEAIKELNDGLGKAANLEKTGKNVSDTLKQNIETKRSAVKMAQNAVNELMTLQMARVHSLTKDIRKLRKIEATSPNNK